MRNYLNIPKPLTITPPPPPPSSSSPLPDKPNLPMFYYGIAVVATATLVLAMYHIVMVRWCTMRYQRHLQHVQQTQLSRQRRRTPTTPNNTMLPPSPSGAAVCSVPSFKYKKQLDYETECSICLSVFQEGEEVKKLPLCDHCFHASCIDMWLYSHILCPLCRVPVVEPPRSSSV